jgi:hypothetical protein
MTMIPTSAVGHAESRALIRRFDKDRSLKDPSFEVCTIWALLIHPLLGAFNLNPAGVV